MATAIERTTRALAEDAAQRAPGVGSEAGGTTSGTAPALVGGISPASIAANITANSKFFFSLVDPNGGTPGFVHPFLPFPGQPGHFQIRSTNPNDTGIYNWMIVEP